jgi:hypothetical protein
MQCTADPHFYMKQVPHHSQPSLDVCRREELMVIVLQEWEFSKDLWKISHMIYSERKSGGIERGGDMA